MRNTKRRNGGLEGAEGHSRFAEDNQERPTEDEIARRAYERYEARGRQDGQALDDWLEAERDLTGAPHH